MQYEKEPASVQRDCGKVTTVDDRHWPSQAPAHAVASGRHFLVDDYSRWRHVRTVYVTLQRMPKYKHLEGPEFEGPAEMVLLRIAEKINGDVDNVTSTKLTFTAQALDGIKEWKTAICNSCGRKINFHAGRIWLSGGYWRYIFWSAQQGYIAIITGGAYADEVITNVHGDVFRMIAYDAQHNIEHEPVPAAWS